ncbi:MAG: type II toxin-antitoxin system ParD family antitoxin [Pseudomonadota bacterium]
MDLGENLESIVEELVRRGRFNSRSEVLRAGVRLLHEREVRIAELDAMIAKGIADADAGRVADVDTGINRLKAEIASRRASAKRRRGVSSSRPRR